MPEHVHLLVYPIVPYPPLDLLLKAIKRPFATRIKRRLVQAQSRLLRRPTIRERPGVEVFRFWQEGGGYDRNLRTEKTVLGSIDYIHLNAVRPGLCNRAVEWRWSSVNHYFQDPPIKDPGLPGVSGLPREFVAH